MKYRLNRAIAATGICSRRRADDLIAAGRVSVNGKSVSDFNFLVDPALDRLEVDGKDLFVRDFEYIIVYKPRGIVTTCEDEKGRENILSVLPLDLRHLKPVGRLDMDSEGLLLLTNDGDFAQRMAHPSHHVYKHYEVTVSGELNSSVVAHLRDGILLDDGKTLPAKVRLIKATKEKSLVEIGIREGRNRQIRRMCAKVGYPVTRLVRVAIGGLQLRQMEPGEWRHLTPEEVDELRSS